MRSSAFSATSRQQRVGSSRSTRRRAASASLIVGAGPSGLSAAYHLARLGHAVEIHEAGPVPGGMMHFGIPAYRLPARRSDEGDPPDRGDGRADHAQPQGRGRRRRSAMPEASMPSSSRSAPHVSRHVDIPARDAAKVLDAVPFLRERRRRRGAAARPPGRRSTAAATRRWMRRARPAGSAPTRR